MSEMLVLNDRTYYEELAGEAQIRRLDGEDKIWEVMPFDPSSEYHRLDATHFDALGTINPIVNEWLVGQIVASNSLELHDTAIEVVRTQRDEFRSKFGAQLKRIKENNGHLFVTIANQSRFESQVVSHMVAYAIADTPEETVETRKVLSTVSSRYLNCFGLRPDKIFGGNSELDEKAMLGIAKFIFGGDVDALANYEKQIKRDKKFVIPSLDVARNFSNMIPVFPNTDIRRSYKINHHTQKYFNKIAMEQGKPVAGKPHIRIEAPTAVFEKELGRDALQIEGVKRSTVESIARDNYDYHMPFACYIDPVEPSKSFMTAGDIDAHYDDSTLHDHYLWIAEERTQRTGKRTVYASSRTKSLV